MAWPATLSVALKEWAAVCSALQSGRQIILLRKGGIYEAAGEFEIEHRQFLLFPTYLHQNLEMLKPTEHAGFAPAGAEPQQIKISAAAQIDKIIPMPSRAAMDALDDQHIWTRPLIDMRFSYRPENPLYLLVLRAYRLTEPATIQNTPAYAGCKSWVPLGQPISAQSQPVLTDAEFETRQRAILQTLSRF
jgi:hypothetical protein